MTMERNNMSQRKIDGYLKLGEVVNWGRKYPVRFVERFFGMELLDYQKYVFMNSWTTPLCFGVWGEIAAKRHLELRL